MFDKRVSLSFVSFVYHQQDKRRAEKGNEEGNREKLKGR